MEEWVYEFLEKLGIWLPRIAIVAIILAGVYGLWFGLFRYSQFANAFCIFAIGLSVIIVVNWWWYNRDEEE